MQQTIKKLYNALEDASKINTLGTGTYIYMKELLDELFEKVSQMQLPVINTTPRICEPVLAEISKSGELGKEGWYEVVYHDGERWQHFAGSDTFDDGERVVKWKYCKECLNIFVPNTIALGLRK